MKKNIILLNTINNNLIINKLNAMFHLHPNQKTFLVWYL